MNKAQAVNFYCLYPLKGSFKPALSSLALFTFFGTMPLPLSSEFRERQGEACDTLFHSAALKADKLILFTDTVFASFSLLDQLLESSIRTEETEKNAQS